MFVGSRARPVRRADSLTAICEPTVYTMLDPQHLTTLYASTACYEDSFTSLTFTFSKVKSHNEAMQAMGREAV
jgi:hypothetical protein